MFIKKSVKVFVLVVLVLALSGFTYAFAAANTMPATSHAGDGSVAITGYTVSNVKYNLDATTPTDILSVTFNLNAPATSARVKLVTTGSWSTPCTFDGTGMVVTCLTPGVTVLAANSLQVVAAE